MGGANGEPSGQIKETVNAVLTEMGKPEHSQQISGLTSTQLSSAGENAGASKG